MTKFVTSILLAIFISIPLHAQESIGFSDSTDFQYIIDYRLPDWGYSNFFLSTASIRNNGGLEIFKLNEARDMDERPYIFEDRQLNNQFNISLRPAYEYYRESEELIIDLFTFNEIRTNFSIRNQVSNPDLEDNPEDTKIDFDSFRRSNAIRQYIQFDSKFYLLDDFFVLTGFLGDLSFSGGTSEATYEYRPDWNIEGEERERYLRAEPEVGIGFGRLRNVGPQIRALRLKERYSTISNGDLNNQETIASAEMFTKRQGYRERYDRFEKYFWEDINEAFSGKLDQLGTYDIFYLNDVFNESIGQRLEGFDVFFSGRFSYLNRLNREEETTNLETSLSRNLEISKSLDVYSQLRWYKNLNLNHQLSLTTEYRTAFPLEKEEELEMNIDLLAEFSWLWTITDRYLLTTKLQNYFEKPVYKERLYNVEQYRNQSYIRSELTYFIENKLALSADLSLGLEQRGNNNHNNGLDHTTNTFRWQCSVNVRYYFARNLF